MNFPDSSLHTLAVQKNHIYTTYLQENSYLNVWKSSSHISLLKHDMRDQIKGE